MKSAPSSLITFFNTAKQCIQFDLWTFLLDSGTTVRWTDADVDLKLTDGRTFVRGPVIKRDQVSWVRGIEVDQLKVELYGPTVTVDGQPLPAFATAGGFDSAFATLERAYLDDTGAVQGTLVWFPGAVADVTPGRMGCDVVVKSLLTQLSQQLPRNVYQASCLNNLYDSNCAVSRAAFTLSGAVTAIGSGYNPAITVSLTGSVAAKHLELGTLNFTSGANIGIGRTIQAQPGSGSVVTLQFSRPWPFPLQVGDAFTAKAGCDKQLATCTSKFNNALRFRGQPFIPVPETVT